MIVKTNIMNDEIGNLVLEYNTKLLIDQMLLLLTFKVHKLFSYNTVKNLVLLSPLPKLLT